MANKSFSGSFDDVMKPRTKPANNKSETAASETDIELKKTPAKNIAETSQNYSDIEPEETQNDISKIAPQKHEEKKSKRLQLLIYPSLYDKIKKGAKANNYTSVNDFVNYLLNEAIKIKHLD